VPRTSPDRSKTCFREDLARTVCARLSAGESDASITRDKTMPSRSTLRQWRLAEPEFAADYEAARAKGGGKQGGGRPELYSAALVDSLCDRIIEGRALHKICRDPDMPSQTTVNRWFKAYPEFREAYRFARELQADRKYDEVWEIARTVRNDTVTTTKVKLAALQWQAGRLAMKGRAPEAEPAPAGTAGPVIAIRRFGPDGEDIGDVVVYPPEQAAAWAAEFGDGDV
jgi:hypothetical protein